MARKSSPKSLREFYGWKVKDIQVALLELQSVTIPEDLFSNCLREPGYLLTKAGHNFDSMVASLEESRRSLPPFPQEVSRELDRAFPRYGGLPLKEFHELIMAPSEAELLKVRKIDFRLQEKKTSYVTHISLLKLKSVLLLLLIKHTLTKRSLRGSRSSTTFCCWSSSPSSIARGDRVHSSILGLSRQFIADRSVLCRGRCSKTTIESVIGHLSATIGKFEKDSNSIYRCVTDTFVMAAIPPMALGFFYTSKMRTLKDFQSLAGMLQTIPQIANNGLLTTRFAVDMRSMK